LLLVSLICTAVFGAGLEPVLAQAPPRAVEWEKTREMITHLAHLFSLIGAGTVSLEWLSRFDVRHPDHPLSVLGGFLTIAGVIFGGLLIYLVHGPSAKTAKIQIGKNQVNLLGPPAFVLAAAVSVAGIIMIISDVAKVVPFFR